MASSSNRERSRSPLREEPLTEWDRDRLRYRREAEFRANWLVEEVNPMIESLASDCPADIRKAFLRLKHYCETGDTHNLIGDPTDIFRGYKKRLAEFRSCLQPQPQSREERRPTNHLDPVSARLARAALETVLLLSRDAELERTRLDLERARMTAEDFRSGGAPACGLQLQYHFNHFGDLNKCRFTVKQWLKQINSQVYDTLSVMVGPRSY